MASSEENWPARPVIRATMRRLATSITSMASARSWLT
jgi:hypothetical protein